MAVQTYTLRSVPYMSRIKNQINYENSKTLLVHCHCIDYNDKFFFM